MQHRASRLASTSPGAVELGISEGEAAAVLDKEPIALAIGGRNHGDHRELLRPAGRRSFKPKRYRT
jgi:hypothetical protein